MGLILRLLVVAGLAVDAYVHFHLAGDMGSGSGLTEGTLFWIQGVLAALGLWRTPPRRRRASSAPARPEASA